MTMMRRFALVLALVAVASTAAMGADTGTNHDKTFMWRVERGETTVYLLGSIHAMKEDSYPLPAVIEQAFAESEVVVFEIDSDEMTAAAFQMLSAGTLTGDRTLESVVGPSVWAKFADRMREAGMSPSMCASMKPWMAALTLTAFEMTKAGYLPSAGIDTYFTGRAKDAGKERMALETVDFQVSLFADLTDDQNMAFLTYTLSDLETLVPELDRLSADWRDGNVSAIEEFLLEGFEEFPDLFDKLVINRNRAWLESIEKVLAGDRDAMVVVGAMHLVGDEGLVHLLRERGHTVEQVSKTLKR
jgi:uncharacterized protein YbaP (TraB family)